MAQENLDDTVSDYSEVITEKFSLIKLITSVVRRETAPLRKQIEELNTTNKLLKEELDALKTEKETVVATGTTGTTCSNVNLKTELAPLKEALKKLAPIEEAVRSHQRYLDHDDAWKRGMNVIITGVKEDTSDDVGKVKAIFQAADCGDVIPLKVKRLGIQGEENIRPLLVVTDSVTIKKKILNNKKKLKQDGEQYKSVYIKADETIAVRKDWRRLKDMLKKEKEEPMNKGCNIKID